MQQRQRSPAASSSSGSNDSSGSIDSSGSLEASASGRDEEHEAAVPPLPQKKKLSVVEAFSFLAASKQVRCLALMAMAQGISTNLLEVRVYLDMQDLAECLHGFMSSPIMPI